MILDFQLIGLVESSICYWILKPAIFCHYVHTKLMENWNLGEIRFTFSWPIAWFLEIFWFSSLNMFSILPFTSDLRFKQRPWKESRSPKPNKTNTSWTQKPLENGKILLVGGQILAVNCRIGPTLRSCRNVIEKGEL